MLAAIGHLDHQHDIIEVWVNEAFQLKYQDGLRSFSELDMSGWEKLTQLRQKYKCIIDYSFPTC